MLSSFWQNILNAIDLKDLSGSGFSEFETYGTYLLNHYINLFVERPLITLRSGYSTYKRILNMDDLKMLPYDTISFENWDI